MNQETFPQSSPEDDSSPNPFEEIAASIEPFTNRSPVEVDYNEVSTISIQEPDPESADKMGADRQDITTSARDAEGRIQKPGSWLMLGYNKEGHEIEMGDYVSLEEVSRAIDDLLVSTGDGARIVRHEPPAEFPDVSSAVQDIFAQALDGHSSIKLTPDYTMPNNNAHGTELRDTEGRTFKSSNILLKNDVQLPDGDYAHKPALDEVTGNYSVVSTPESPVEVDYNEVSTISIQEPDPESADKMGADRQDITTSARDAEGRIQKPGSWLMLGYNKEGHEIEMGDYVSLEEVSRAIDDLLVSTGDGARIVRHEPPAEFPDVSSAVQDIFAQALDGHSSIKLTPDYTMPNNNAHGTELRDTEGRTFKSSNILLKNDVQLPDGDYAHKPALDETMGNYAIKPPIGTPSTSNQQPNNNQNMEE